VHKLKSATPNLRVINLYGINFVDDSHIEAFSSNCIQVKIWKPSFLNWIKVKSTLEAFHRGQYMLLAFAWREWGKIWSTSLSGVISYRVTNGHVEHNRWSHIFWKHIERQLPEIRKYIKKNVNLSVKMTNYIEKTEEFRINSEYIWNLVSIKLHVFSLMIKHCALTAGMSGSELLF
jgi:hypothetical protein